MDLRQIDVTGCRIVGAITKELGHAGPKHHGVILGENILSREIYIAESLLTGYTICSFTDFNSRYATNGEIIVYPNDGDKENLAVAQSAIDELGQGGIGKYNLLTNNCESFVNRIMRGKSTSDQVINTAIGALILLGAVYVLRNSK